MIFSNNKKRIYLDYASGAPLRPEAAEAARAAEVAYPGNPSSIHQDGTEARRALTEARAAIAKHFDVHAEEILFVGSGTESDNLAIIGTVRAAKDFTQKHVITTAIEHPAVLDAMAALEREGVAVTYLPVGEDGRLDPRAVRDALRPETVLVSIGYANSEIGVVQPIRDIAKEIRHFKKQNTSDTYPLLHTDAAQAISYLSIRIPELGVDLLSCNASKIGGPRGVGMLYARRAIAIEPIIYGGGQERGLRSGTENTPGVLGFAAALAVTRKEHAQESERLQSLRDLFFLRVQEALKGARINGSREHRLSNNVHISLPGILSELLVIELDARGIAASAGSACGSAEKDASHVMEALYGTESERSWGSVRFSFGKATTSQHIDRALRALEEIQEKYGAWSE